ncbi:unnamed protein product [Scytosiphon promiscuus]
MFFFCTVVARVFIRHSPRGSMRYSGLLRRGGCLFSVADAVANVEVILSMTTFCLWLLTRWSDAMTARPVTIPVLHSVANRKGFCPRTCDFYKLRLFSFKPCANVMQPPAAAWQALVS